MKILIVPVSWNSTFKDSASERFRCDWLLPHLPADKYDGSQEPNDYDVIIYQKGFRPDMLEERHGLLTVFDSTDPFWLVSNQDELKFLYEHVDLITVPTPGLAGSCEKTCPLPVYVVPDGHDLKYYEVTKIHKKRRPVFVWFGYSLNWDQSTDLIDAISDYKLITISDSPVGWRKDQWIKWDINTVNENIVKGDIVLCPRDPNGFKSDNKKITSWALGMPIVEVPEDIPKFLEWEAREHDQTLHTWDIIQHRAQASADKMRGILARSLELSVVGRQLNGT